MRRFLSRAAFGAGVAALLLSGSARAAPAVRVTPADARTIQKAVAARRGRVVVVAMWATWCGPCVAELPGLAALSRRYQGRGLSVLGVSLDSGADARARVASLLARKGVTYPVFLARDADPEPFIRAFGGGWQGDLPQTFLYDRRGRLVRTLSQAQTASTLEAAVRPFLSR